MSIDATRVKSFVISSHPYAFDAMFVSTTTRGKRWTGAGQVVFHAVRGGVNQVWALVEADVEGHAGLKEAGFHVQSADKGQYVDSSGESYVVQEDGGLVHRLSDARPKLAAKGLYLVKTS